MTAIAYRIEDAAAMCAVSDKRIRQAMRDGELVASYPDSKPRFTHDELRDWVASWSRKPA